MFIQPGSMRDIIQQASPGPWSDPAYDDYPGDTGWWVHSGIQGAATEHAVIVTNSSWTERAYENAKYIATFDPHMVEAMCDVIDASSELEGWNGWDLEEAQNNLNRIKQEKGLP